MATAAVPLDETMLAMDVVDTLRHAETLVARELAGDERRQTLRARLREIYASQGIAVPEHVLDQGIAALEERRFAYARQGRGWRRWLAERWVTRAQWGRTALIGTGAAALLVIGWYGAVVVPEHRRAAAVERELTVTLPRALEAEEGRVLAATRDAALRADAARLRGEGEAAVAAANLAEARARRDALATLAARLSAAYTVRIVNRPGESSGVWRVPALNPSARNFYLVVEAIDADGRPVAVPVTSEEDGETRRVSRWAQRVSEAEFERVRRDKLADGVIDQPVIGRKQAGTLATAWTVATPGGAILAW